MILQCEQCNTKFRLDDSKLKPGGVKVRCSKCRHVFLAGAEAPQEETDFDALLSGLGAPAPEATPPSEPPAPPAAAAATADAEPPSTGEAAEETPAAPAPSADFGDFSFEEPPAGEPAAPQPPAEMPAEMPAAGGDFDFSFEETPPSASEPESEPAAPAFPGVTEFSFESSPTVTREKGAAAADRFAGPDEFSFEDEADSAAAQANYQPTGDAAPHGELTFDLGSASGKEEPPVSEEMAGFAELDFSQEHSAEEAAPAAAEPAGSGEFSFQPEPVASPAAPAATGDLDFGAFTFEAEPAAVPAPEAAPTSPGEFDFNDFSFDGAADEPPAEPAKKAPASEFSLGDFSFDEPAPAAVPAEPEGGAQAEQGAAMEEPVKEEFSFGDFSFGEEKAPEIPAPPAAPVADKGVGSFSFNEDLLADSTLGAAVSAGGAAGLAAEEVEPEPAPVPSAGPAEEVKGPSFPFGEETAAAAGGFDPSKVALYDEDLEDAPPLTIPSRRKGRSIASLSAGVVGVVLLAGLCGAGFYFVKGGPAALDKVGLGFVAKWFGMEGAEDGRIAIVHPLASFYQNKAAGELFVVSGEAENQFRKPRASIHVRVTLFDKSGKSLMQKTAYCGNRISDAQLTTLPMAKLDEAMNNQFGDSLANLGVKPGEKIPFVVAIGNVPKEAADFGVEVVGSTVAGP